MPVVRIGHFLDHKGMATSGAKGFASERSGGNADMDALVAAMRASQSVREIEAMPSRMMGAAHKSYLLEPSEMFARAYSQYIARHGGDEKMASELMVVQGSPQWYYQWSNEDFSPIDAAITKLFKGKGWIK